MQITFPNCKDKSKGKVFELFWTLTELRQQIKSGIINNEYMHDGYINIYVKNKTGRINALTILKQSIGYIRFLSPSCKVTTKK